VVDYTTVDKDGCAAPCCRPVCVVANVIPKQEGLPRFEEYLTEETNIYTVLADKTLQFKLPAAHSVLISTNEAQGFTPLYPPRACCHIRLQNE